MTVAPAARVHSRPIRRGVFIAVAGPSGAGKDSIIDYARRHCDPAASDVEFVRRIITRSSDGLGEVHDCLSESAFEEARMAGRFSIDWEANGLKYALPARVNDVMEAGGIVVANVSRAIIPLLRDRYRNLLVVVITASQPVLANRLAQRGREDESEIAQRLRRASTGSAMVDAAIVIDNSGPLDIAGKQFLALLANCRATQSTPPDQEER